MRIFIMFNVDLKWAKNVEQLRELGLYNGCKYLCVNFDGVVFHLMYNEDYDCFVSANGKTYQFDDFVEFTDMSIE